VELQLSGYNGSSFHGMAMPWAQRLYAAGLCTMWPNGSTGLHHKAPSGRFLAPLVHLRSGAGMLVASAGYHSGCRAWGGDHAFSN